MIIEARKRNIAVEAPYGIQKKIAKYTPETEQETSWDRKASAWKAAVSSPF